MEPRESLAGRAAAGLRRWMGWPGWMGLLASCLAAGVALADDTALRIIYGAAFEGQPVAEDGETILECDRAVAVLRVAYDRALLAGAPIETRAIDYGAGRTYQTARLRDGARITTTAEFGSLPPLEWSEERTEILGRSCRLARTTLRSNRIELWVDESAPVSGSPSTQFVAPTGLILRLVRNGNYVVEARSIEPLDPGSPRPRLEADWGTMLDLPAYRARVTDGYITTVSIFERDPIAWENGAPVPADSSGLLRLGNGTLIARKVRLPRATPDVAIFAELTHRSRGDAYDRTGLVFALPAAQARSFFAAISGDSSATPLLEGRMGRRYRGVTAREGFTPPLELLRYITPFGVGHYNQQVQVDGLVWEDSLRFKIDVTDLISHLQEEVWFVAVIENYDRGGHEVSLRLRYYPGERFAPSGEESETGASRLAPLFSTVNLIGMSGFDRGRLFEHDTLRVRFSLPAGAQKPRLRYFTTGHGGWGGGDEFTPRTNSIILDGKLLTAITPWRSDCATFRRLNPASGNFWNGLSSSDFSRSGWCPGMPVDPYWIPLGELPPGEHELRVAIPMGAPEGSSTSAWLVSGALSWEGRAREE
ncbi:MAG: peptide-N-glycosidase [Candidatus Eisenbacteria bacterium]|nr:peptide-N-glycosidase [Candidatus Eisenbacteria bacterium]